MNKLTLYQNFTIKDDIKPLKQLPRLTYVITQDRHSLKIPNSIELILLSINLLFVGNQILKNQAKCKKGLCVEMYIKKAIELQKILDDYENTYIDMKEFNQIKKKFGLNGLYK